jgi:putative phage-type endonuclease
MLSSQQMIADTKSQNNGTVHYYVEMRFIMITEQQRIERQLGIGGSDMPIILGLSSYKTPYQLYLEKISETLPEDEQSEQQYWGSQLEGIVRDEFAKRNNVTVETPDTISHPDYDFLRGNIDGFIPEWNAVLEVKCANQFSAKQWGDEGSDAIPMQYLVQVAFYCMITNADCAYIAVLIGGNDYRQFKYQRNIELEGMLKEKALEFWKRVENKQPPAATAQIDLRLMFPLHAPEKIKPINEPIAEQLTKLSEIKNKIKALSIDEEIHKFNIMKYMEDAEALTDGEETLVTFKANKRGSRSFLLKGVN